MWASVILCILVAVLTFYQVFTQGLFSSFIMAGLCMISAFLALNFYEPLAEILGRFGIGSLGPQTICLMGLFVLSLLALRELTDRLVRGNIHFPLFIDRIGAAVFGLISSMIVVGMIALGFQHLSISAEILGFNRCPNLDNAKEDKGLFPGADGFVVSLISQASRFSFAGANKFFQHHPDFLRELYMNRLALDPASRREACSEAIGHTKKVWLIDHDLRDIFSMQVVRAPEGQRFVAVRMVVKTSAATEKQSGAVDVDGRVRFTLGSVRLVGFDERQGYSRYPIGILKPGGRMIEKIPLDQGKILTARGRSQVDLVFEWPMDLETSPPRYLEFKRSARVSMPDAARLEAFKLEPKDFYEAAITATEADIKAPTKEPTPYIIEKIKVVESGSNQPFAEMLLPPNEVLGDMLSLQDRSRGIRNFYPEPILDPGRSRNDSSSYTRLYIPNGFSLVYVSAKKNPLGGMKGLYVPPVLIDMQGREHRSVGYALRGNLEGKNYQGLAYSAYNSKGSILTLSEAALGPAAKIQLQDLGGQVDRIVTFYLIGRRSIPVGLLAAWIPISRSRPTAVWKWDKQIDAVLVPAY